MDFFSYAFTMLLVYLKLVGCDQCDTCRRQTRTCHTISGAFTKRRLPQGYNFIARIPAGACTINITELGPSSNYIALKSVRGADILNSQWAITSAGNYHRGGTILKYGRGRDSNCPGECVLALGPTNVAIEFQLLTYHTNPGILYQYQIPGRRTHRKRQNGRRHHGGNWKKHNRRHPHKRRHEHLARKSVPLGQTQAFSSARTVTRDFGPRTAKVVPPHVDKDTRKASVNLSTPLKTFDNSDPVISVKDGKSQVEHLKVGHGQDQHRLSTSATRQLYHTPNLPRHTTQQGPVSGNQYAHTKHRKASGFRRHHLGYQALTLSERSDTSGVKKVHSPQSARLTPPLYLPLSGYVSRNPNQNVYSERTAAGSYIPYRENLHHGPKYPSQENLPRHTNVYNGDQIQTARGDFPQVLVRETPKYISPYGDDLPYNPVQPLENGGDQNQHVGPPIDTNSYFDNKHEIPLPTEGIFPERRGGHNEPLLPDRNSYVVPQNPLPDTDYSHEGEVRTVQYSWRISGFTNCSEECGGGVQETVIICVKGKSEAIVTEDNCDARVKPEPQQVQCNTKPCPPQWESGDWTECSVTCGSGLQSRRVECKKRVSPSLQISVSADRCPLSDKPSIIQQCGSAPCARWNVQDWGACSVNCGKGERHRKVECVNNNDKAIPDTHCTGERPVTMETCHRGTCTKHWYHTNWSDKCSSDCGEGVSTRQVVCMSRDGRVLKEKRCHRGSKPASQKSCQSNRVCGGQWFVGPWKQCSSVCGKGVTLRELVCMKVSDGGVSMPVSDTECDPADRPDTEKVCHGTDCGLQWYMTDWSKCSVTCGNGEQSRQVRCIDSERRVSTECEQINKPPTSRPCSLPGCTLKTANMDANCKDELTNCIVVAQARLCRYKFYKSVCCATCSSPHH